MRELVAAGSPLELGSSAGWTALRWAAMLCDVRIIKLLLDGKYEGKGACINMQDNQGSTPLITVIVRGKEDVVRLLLERGADATLRCNDGRTALAIARGRNNATLVALLEAHGARE